MLKLGVCASSTLSELNLGLNSAFSGSFNQARPMSRLDLTFCHFLRYTFDLFSHSTFLRTFLLTIVPTGTFLLEMRDLDLCLNLSSARTRPFSSPTFVRTRLQTKLFFHLSLTYGNFTIIPIKALLELDFFRN